MFNHLLTIFLCLFHFNMFLIFKSHTLHHCTTRPALWPATCRLLRSCFRPRAPSWWPPVQAASHRLTISTRDRPPTPTGSTRSCRTRPRSACPPPLCTSRLRWEPSAPTPTTSRLSQHFFHLYTQISPIVLFFFFLI